MIIARVMACIWLRSFHSMVRILARKFLASPDYSLDLGALGDPARRVAEWFPQHNPDPVGCVFSTYNPGSWCVVFLAWFPGGNVPDPADPGDPPWEKTNLDDNTIRLHHKRMHRTFKKLIKNVFSFLYVWINNTEQIQKIYFTFSSCKFLLNIISLIL
jgi:hypothetical protein